MIVASHYGKAGLTIRGRAKLPYPNLFRGIDLLAFSVQAQILPMYHKSTPVCGPRQQRPLWGDTRTMGPMQCRQIYSGVNHDALPTVLVFWAHRWVLSAASMGEGE